MKRATIDYVTTLRRWAALRPRHKKIHWAPAKKLIEAAQATFREEAVNLRECIERSNDALHPLKDPLHVDFGLHRWLQGSREEAYSDWLSWLFEQLPASSIPRILGIDLAEAETSDESNTGRAVVQRETWIEKLPQWHQRRRTDLLIFLGDALILVEVKVVRPEQADLEKNSDYAEWLSRRTERQKKKVLITLKGNVPDDNAGFTLRYWDEVCVELRKAARIAVRKGHVVAAAMALAFVGAIEQNLLRFSAARVQQILKGNFAAVTSEISDHLEKYLAEDF